MKQYDFKIIFILGRTKCASIIKNVVYPFLCEELKEDLKNKKYSLIIDESTDIAVHKQLAIVIKYYSSKNQKIVTTFLKMIQLSSGDAQSIFNVIISTLKEFNLNICNMVGLGTDNANVMVGAISGVITKLKELNPNIVLIPCICHSLQLSITHAATHHLPRNIEFLISETYNWFGRSTQRRTNYKKMYNVINNGHDPLKIVQSSNTRWMSIETAVNRILEQWVELELHFAMVKQTEKCYMAEQLHLMYQDKTNLCYLYFLSSVLTPLQKVNKLFESNDVDITKILSSLMNLLKSLMSIIVPARPDFDVLKSNIHDYIIPQPYLGYRCEEEIKKMKNSNVLNSTMESSLRNRCINFLTHLLEELRARLPNNISILEKIELLSVENMRGSKRLSIIPLLKTFGVSDSSIEKILWQYNNIASIYSTISEIKNTETFWIEMSKQRDASNENPFADLCNFALNVLSMSYSNAEVERVFSAMNLIKNKQRNRMEDLLLNSIVFLKTQMRVQSKCCYSFEVNERILKKIGNMATYAVPQVDIVEMEELDFAFESIIENI